MVDLKAYSERMSNILTTFKYVNHGGCGVVALELTRQFDKLGVDYSIHIAYYLNDEYEVIKAIKEAIKDDSVRHLKYINWVHVVLKVGDYYFDSNGLTIGYDNSGVEKGFEVNICQYPITKRLLDKLIKSGTWNDVFFNHHKCSDVKKFIREKVFLK